MTFLNVTMLDPPSPDRTPILIAVDRIETIQRHCDGTIGIFLAGNGFPIEVEETFEIISNLLNESGHKVMP